MIYVRGYNTCYVFHIYVIYISCKMRNVRANLTDCPEKDGDLTLTTILNHNSSRVVNITEILSEGRALKRSCIHYHACQHDKQCSAAI